MASSDPILDALLDSWDRNNQILIGLLRLLPPGAFDLRTHPDSPTIGEWFDHLHYCREIFVWEDAPECGHPVEEHARVVERDVDRLTEKLNSSAQLVSGAVRSRLAAGRGMDVHYDHPILMLQHLLWHDAYHHGQIKLALKLAGQPLSDDDAGPVTWDVWMDKH